MRKLIALVLMISIGFWAATDQAQTIVGRRFGINPIPAFTNTARSCNGTSDHMDTTVSVGNTLAFDGGQAGPWTIAFWMKSEDLTQTNRYVYDTFYSPDGHTDNPAIIYGFVNDGSGHATIEAFANDIGDLRTGSGLTPTDTNWHYIAYRHAAAGGEYAKFFDGSKTIIAANRTFTNHNGTGVVVCAGSTGGGGGFGFAAYAHVSIAHFIQTQTSISDSDIATLAGSCITSGITLATNSDYWPFLGAASPEPEHSPSTNTYSLTVTGTTQVSGPPSCTGL